MRFIVSIMETDTSSRLRYARRHAGLSQEALAHQVVPPCSTQTIRHAEHGMCSAAMLDRIAAALGVSVEDIR